MDYNDSLSVVFYIAGYKWQGVTLYFLNTIEIIRPTTLNQLKSHKILVTNKRYFYSAHAKDLKALHSLEMFNLSFL